MAQTDGERWPQPKAETGMDGHPKEDCRLWGFWSYSRDLEQASGQLQEVLEASLRGALGRAPEVTIFRDVEQLDGTYWSQELVRAIRRSVLFFWLQSPSHLNSPICRLELDMFRAQVARIADHFCVPGNASRLFEHWIVPIRWQDMHEDMWPSLRSDPATSEIAQLWYYTQVHSHFDIAKHGHSEASYREHGIAMGTAVRDKLYQSLPLLGRAPSTELLAQLLAFLAREDLAFEQDWLAALQGIPGPPKKHRPGPGRPPPTIDPKSTYRWPDALSFEPYIREKRESFSGRAWLFAEVDQWLASGEDRALLIRANFGVGKSALVAEYLGRDREQRTNKVVAHHFCRHDRQDTLRPGAFVRSIASQLGGSLPAYRQAIWSNEKLQKHLTDESDSDPMSALEAAVLAPLLDVPPPDGARLLVVDSMDEALALESGGVGKHVTIVDLLTSSSRSLPPWLRILVTSRPLSLKVSRQLAEAFTLREINAEDANNDADLREYVLARSSRAAIARLLDEAGITADAFARALVKKSGGKFLYLVHVLREVASGIISVKDPDSLPYGMDRFYEGAFERRFGPDQDKYRKARELLEVICAAAEPLSPLELGEILRDTDASVRQIQSQQLPDFVKLQGKQLSLDHASLKDWLTLIDSETGLARAGPFAINLAEGQSRIHSWAQQRVRASTVHMNGYLLRNLATHLTDDEERRDVYTQLLLERFEWSQARLDTSGVAGLLEDTRWIKGHPEQGLLQTLVRNSEPALRRSSAHWCAQVLGRLGVGQANVGIPSLASSARGFLATLAAANDTLLPRTRSLRLLTAQDQMLEGHTQAINVLAVLPGARVASGSDDGTLRVWDLARGAFLQVLDGHTDSVTAMAVLPDARVVTGSDDGTLRVWDLARGASLQVLAGHTDSVTAIAVLPDARVVTGSDDETLRVWDLARGVSLQVLEGHTDSVTAIAVLSDARVVTGSDDETLRVWDLPSGAVVQVLHGHTDSVNALAALPNACVISGSEDGTLRVWDLARGTAVQVLQGHTDSVNALAVLPNARVVSGGDDRTLRVWDLARGAMVQVLHGHADSVNAFAVLPDGRVVSGSDDRTLRIWNLARSAAMQVFEEHTDSVTALAMLPDDRVASGSQDGTLRVWDLAYGAAVQVLKGHTDSVTAIAALPDAHMVTCSEDETLRVWDLAGGAAVQVLKGHSIAA
jgi:WD40 repeat protein